jgi:integrase
MSVRLVPYEGDRWEVDISVRLATGKNHREKKVLAVSRTIAKRWGEERERHLLLHGIPATTKEVPTLNDFQERFLNEYCRANRLKSSGINQKATVLRVHLLPPLGTKRLDTITTGDVQRLKHAMRGSSPKTTNNTLSCLSKLLKVAVEWGVIDEMPCTVKLLKPGESMMQFWDFEEYQRLVDAAAGLDSSTYVAVLLGGDAGLRAGEIRALEQPDIDRKAGKIVVARSEWRGEVGTTKGNRIRTVPMSRRLAEALQRHRHLKGPRVLCGHDGEPLNANTLSYWIERAVRSAGLATLRKPKGTGPHVLRHTFCSHHAMNGTPATVIQALAGHRHLATTMRYMHLCKGVADDAIAALELRRAAQPQGHADRGFGARTEADDLQMAK